MTLKEQFEAMDRMPIIEINMADYIGGEDDYIIFDISADDTGLRTNNIFVEWDNIFSLDEHLQSLYNLIIEDVLNA